MPREHALGRPLIIANPRAGTGRRSALPTLRAALDERGLAYDVQITGGRGHARHLAQVAVEDHGRRYLIALGGDGTVHEVVNGLVDAETGRARADDLVLGIANAGSGSDLARTFGLDRPVQHLADHFVSETVTPLDLGVVHFHDRHGEPRSRVFANVAQLGFGGQVVATSSRLPRRMGRSRYGLAIVVAWARFRRQPTRVVFDGGEVTESLCNVVVANGQFFGGGMQVAPRALPDDGLFSLQAWGGRVGDLVRAGRQLRDGDHLGRPDVREWRTRSAQVWTRDPAIVEADGEVLGRGPARFEVVPQALSLKL